MERCEQFMLCRFSPPRLKDRLNEGSLRLAATRVIEFLLLLLFFGIASMNFQQPPPSSALARRFPFPYCY